MAIDAVPIIVNSIKPNKIGNIRGVVRGDGVIGLAGARPAIVALDDRAALAGNEFPSDRRATASVAAVRVGSIGSTVGCKKGGMGAEPVAEGDGNRESHSSILAGR